MRLGYLGPPGTFSEEALRAHGRGDPPGAGGHERVPYATIPDALQAVRDGEVDRALVPIENALEGAVNATLDGLAAEAPDVAIVGETVLGIRTCLIAAGPLELGDVRVVVSHPQPLGQCARFLRRELPGAEVRAATSTAEAVRTVTASREPLAALGPRGAAELYGGTILRDGVDDDADNATRFVWVARSGTPPDGAARADAWKTSIAFAGAGDRAPGWLVRCLSEFAFRGVNLTKIESRPRRAQLGHYVFFVDAEGRADEAAVADAVASLHAHCEEVRVLGCYPAS
jgi:prephenate dehydratase